MSGSIELSIIIPTRNSAVSLRRCLDSIRYDEGVALEVIVVDQDSGDGTPEVAIAAGAHTITAPPSAVYTPPTRSRNLGAALAQGEYLLHLDADMSLEPRALPILLKAARQNGYAAIILEEIDEPVGFWSACKALERQTYRFSEIEAARLVRADVFREVGGYDETLGSGEDWDIHARYAGRGAIGRQPAALRHHLGRLSIASQVQKKFAYGKSAPAFLRKHESRSFAGAAALAYARSWRLFARHPAHALGFAVLRLGETGAIALGMSTELFRQRALRRDRS